MKCELFLVCEVFFMEDSVFSLTGRQRIFCKYLQNLSIQVSYFFFLKKIIVDINCRIWVWRIERNISMIINVIFFYIYISSGYAS